MTLSFQQRTKTSCRSGKPRMEWTLRRPDGRTVARYHCSPTTFNPQRLVELVNRVTLDQSRVETVPVHLL